jgi:hypothetical protein
MVLAQHPAAVDQNESPNLPSWWNRKPFHPKAVESGIDPLVGPDDFSPTKSKI